MDKNHQTERPMSHSENDRDSGVGSSSAVATVCIDRIERLARRVEAFFRRQETQLLRMWDELECEDESYADWEQMTSEFQKQQSEWEQSKQREAAKIVEELEMLTTAWDRIEAERRVRLSAGELTPTEQCADPVAAPAPPPAPISTSMLPLDIDQSPVGRSAALQFQQIKREIRRHAGRSRS